MSGEKGERVLQRASHLDELTCRSMAGSGTDSDDVPTTRTLAPRPNGTRHCVSALGHQVPRPGSVITRAEDPTYPSASRCRQGPVQRTMGTPKRLLPRLRSRGLLVLQRARQPRVLRLPAQLPEKPHHRCIRPQNPAAQQAGRRTRASLPIPSTTRGTLSPEGWLVLERHPYSYCAILTSAGPTTRPSCKAEPSRGFSS